MTIGEIMKRNVNGRVPDIVLSHVDHDRLAALADAALDRLPELAETLLTELDRASVVADDRVPDGVVRMGSMVEYEARDGRLRVQLVYPELADISAGRISVLTPIGTALLGLSAGQSIEWQTRDGRRQELKVLAVAPPAVEG
jgi:regulator of nucleoside diphosphate kinase